MIAVYCLGDPRSASPLHALSTPESVAIVGNWAALRHSAREARCVVLIAPWLATGSTVSQIAALRRQLPSVPVVIATTKDADNIRHLAGCAVDEIVWLHEIDRELSSAVARACGTGLLARLGRGFATAPGLPPVLRSALAHACRPDCAVRSVSELATAIGKHPHTLWYHWHHALGTAARLRLEDCLDWILLLRAWHLREGAQGWDSVARKLHVHEHTLARLIRRLTTRTPGELWLLPHSVVPELVDEALREAIGAGALRAKERATVVATPRAPTSAVKAPDARAGDATRGDDHVGNSTP